MNKKDLSELTDHELVQEAKKKRSAAIVNALLIGFLLGIILYSLLNNSLGFIILIPLFIIYKLVNASQYDKEDLEQELKERKLK